MYCTLALQNVLILMSKTFSQDCSKKLTYQCLNVLKKFSFLSEEKQFSKPTRNYFENPKKVQWHQRSTYKKLFLFVSYNTRVFFCHGSFFPSYTREGVSYNPKVCSSRTQRASHGIPLVSRRILPSLAAENIWQEERAKKGILP